MNQNPYSVGNNLDPQNNNLQTANLEGSIRGMQIITGALMTGVLVFSGVVFVTTEGRIDGPPEMITMIAAGFAFLMLVNHFVIPPIIVKAQLKELVAAELHQKTDEERVPRCCGVYQTQMIIGFALLEGAAFFNLVAMMMEHCVASIVVVTLLVLLMMAKFPTRETVSFWVQDKLRELQI
ncbi:MAG: hypothetical protein O2856_12820 [Planctomycetota bacterium]|nr:hypothetical protein [Planctomycetota bacterium]